ncbi:MAG: penicillin-binding protein activator [Endozoicomonadaceae bacterium]|nr:penicillin-binding protein activator [Endozoicomonadaceae bacterium]
MNKHFYFLIVFMVVCPVLGGCALFSTKKTPAVNANIENVQKTEDLQNTDTENVQKKAAVLLPLSGPSSIAGHTILKGLLTAFYQQKDDLTSTPTTLEFFDSYELQNNKILKQLVKKQPDIIIGPLTHQSVRKIIKSKNINRPWLLLNYTDQPPNNKNIYQTGLSVKHEISFLVEQAIDSGYKRALIFLENSSINKYIYRNLVERWNILGGRVIKTTEIYKKENINATVAKTLLINESKTRRNKLQKILSEKIDFTPGSRQDVDLVFIIASKNIIRQINPALKFYFAKNLPVLGLPSLCTNETKKTTDLDDVFFACPERKQHQSQQPFRVQPQSKTPDTEIENFFVLGANAGYIYPKLLQSTIKPGTSFQGYSGWLTVNDKQQIYQNLHWATFKNGIISMTLLTQKNNILTDKK